MKHLLKTLLFLPLLALAEVRETQSLDGTWKIAFDPENEGRAASWHKQDVFSSLEYTEDIAVPSCWELIKQDFEGVGFYGTTFTTPASWKEKCVKLHFGAVNYIAEVWLNDICLGRHEGGYGDFEFHVADALKHGEENFLSVRVISPIVATDQVIDGLGPNDAPHWRAAIAGGIWQSVQLVASGSAIVADTFVIPKIAENAAHVKLELENTTTSTISSQVEVTITPAADHTQIISTQTLEMPLIPGSNAAETLLPIENPRYWSPSDPHLYTVHAKITSGETVQDLERTNFGMRELTIVDKEFRLNGERIYVKAAFFEGLYPNGLAYPDSPEMARREIQLAKDAGFNMIRPWRKPPPSMWLDLCDEMGVMVVGGLPIECMKRWPTVTPQMPERIENEVRSSIGRDRNRACIVQWEIFNEIWRTELSRLKHPMSMLARKLDPSRLILDESGGFADGANMYLPYQYEPMKFNDSHIYCGAPVSDHTYHEFETLGIEQHQHAKVGLMTFVSEIGYGSLPNLIDNNKRFTETGNPKTPAYRYHKMLAETFTTALQESGLDSVYADLEQFCLDQQKIHSEGNKRMIEGIRTNPVIQGYCVHALTGGDWVLGAGLLDLFRNPKGSYDGTKHANQPQYLALRVIPRNVYADKGAQITLKGINDLTAVEGMLALTVKDATGKVVLEKSSEISLASGISDLLSEQFDASALSGNYTAHVTLTGKEGTVITENTVWFDVYNQDALTAPQGEIAVLDYNNTLKPHLTRMGIPFQPFTADIPVSTPVYVGKITLKHKKDQYKTLAEFVKKGGTAVYLEHVTRNTANPYWSGKALPQDFLPIETTMKKSMGLWVGIGHVVTDHPVFAGLPHSQLMGQAYENVYAPQTLLISGSTIYAGSVSHSYHEDNDRHQHHQGPQPGWAGMDIGEVSHGEGRYILSGLRIMENLGKDPVADKLLINLLNWTKR